MGKNSAEVSTDRIINRFQISVIDWYKRNGRLFPWRQTRDPFKILIAEILLKLTGANKIVQTYDYLVSNYGTTMQMANADPTELIQSFKGLGLVNRASILTNIANDINIRFNGRFPRAYSELTSLKGIGQYTANAILCFAFNERVPIVDGSIYRIFNRCFNYRTEKMAYADLGLWQFACDLLPERGYREYNFGLLDIGAVLCKHRNPACTSCPVLELCTYFERRQTDG